MARFIVAAVPFKSRVGDVLGNAKALLAFASAFHEQRPEVDLLIFPEQALMGMPAYDLLWREAAPHRVQEALAQLSSGLPLPVLLGYPKWEGGKCFNVWGLLGPDVPAVEHQQTTFSFGAVDDGSHHSTYFTPGKAGTVFTLKNIRFGLALGEDLHNEDLLQQYEAQEVQWVIHGQNVSYALGHEQEMQHLSQGITQRFSFGLVHHSTVAAQGGLVFQGGSHVLHGERGMLAQLPLFQEQPLLCDLVQATACEALPEQPVEAQLYKALKLAVADYVNSNGFKGALLGLSGGIDSALTLAIAVDALGAERVQAIMMPFDYTSAMSKADAHEQAKTLGVRYQEIPIRPAFDGFMELLAPELAQGELGTTKENLQARCRGVILMALSNKNGHVVLACSNKSECAVGYTTLYGDMVGGFSVLKDVPKTWVYRLAKWRNEQQAQPVIPQRVIERPPTAELAPGQLDTQSLPDYAILDEIVERYVELRQDVGTLIAAGLPAKDVQRVVSLIDGNEYKRQQGAIGPKVTRRAFGINHRYPVSYRW